MKMFLLGMLVMSIVATIGLIIENKTDGRVTALCLGPAMWAYLFTSTLYYRIQIWFRFLNVRSILLDEDGYPWAVPHYAVEAYRTIGWDFPPLKSQLYKTCCERADEWNPRFVHSNVPNTRYAPKSVWKDFPQVSKKEAKKIMKRYSRSVI